MVQTFNDIGGVGQLGTWKTPDGKTYIGPKTNSADVATFGTHTSTPVTAPKKPVPPTAPVVPIKTNTGQPGAINPPAETGGAQNATNPANLLDSFTFSKLLTSMSAPLQKNQDLVDARNKVFTYLYDRPLTEEEKSSLTPSLQRAMESNDRNLIDMEVRLINDEIQGRKDTLDQSMKYITEGYRASLEEADKARNDAETQKQNAIDNVFRNAQLYGGSKLKELYTPEQIQALKDMGVDIDMLSMPTLAETKSETNLGPSSYQEWSLAGGLAGTGKTYAQWLEKTNAGRPLPVGATTTLSEGFQIPLVTKSLDDLIKNKADLFGPIGGRLQTLNPWNKESQTAQADLKRAAQVIGKYMEGGVLRKEDEEKYREMLPNLSDTVDVAEDKLNKVRILLADKSNQYISDYESAGFDVSGFKGKLPGTEGATEDLRTKVIKLGYDYDKMSEKYTNEEIKSELNL